MASEAVVQAGWVKYAYLFQHRSVPRKREASNQPHLLPPISTIGFDMRGYQNSPGNSLPEDLPSHRRAATNAKFQRDTEFTQAA